MLSPPVEPMLAKVAEQLPAGGSYLYEPKWDGFRAIVFRGRDDVYIQSRDLKPFDRYFPELHRSLLDLLPAGCVVDGEIVIVTANGLDFDALQLRLHPAASRIEKLSKAIPASFVAFDVLAIDDKSVMTFTQSERRAMLEALLHSAQPPLYVTPVTREHDVAVNWLAQFEGAGLDGVIAKPLDSAYLPGKRAMLKIKHARSADCVVAGFRWYKDSTDAVGSLLLGLYDGGGVLHHVGVTSAFTMAMRKSLARELEPLRRNAIDGHPGRYGRVKTRMLPRACPADKAAGPVAGSVLGTASNRARGRGQVRPPAGRPLPPRDAFLRWRQISRPTIAATTSSR
jgi:ATP-dependent DNA ligase